jgi:hypothetical protein
MRLRTLAAVLSAVFAVACASCGKKSQPRVGGGNSDPPSAAPAAGQSGGTKSSTPFLTGSKVVPARMEWNRDFGSSKGGTVAFRVTSTAPFGITIVTDKAYQAMKRGSTAKIGRSEGLFMTEAQPPSYEGRVTVPPGMAWIIIENQSDTPATIQLECFEVR